MTPQGSKEEFFWSPLSRPTASGSDVIHSDQRRENKAWLCSWQPIRDFAASPSWEMARTASVRSLDRISKQNIVLSISILMHYEDLTGPYPEPGVSGPYLSEIYFIIISHLSASFLCRLFTSGIRTNNYIYFPFVSHLPPILSFMV
jgi:hypothetical protein